MTDAGRASVSSERRRSLGDVLRAHAQLQPTDAVTAARIARLMGYGFEPPAPRPATEPPSTHQRSAAEDQPRSPGSSSARRERPDDHDDDLPSEGETPREVAPEWPEGEAPVRRTLPAATEHPFVLRSPHVATGPRTAHLSLFSPRVQRALLGGLIAKPCRSGAVDVAAMVSDVARGRPIRRLPRILRWSIRRPVDVLVDLGDSMQPFRRDQVQLLGLLRRLLGAHRVRVGAFRDLPQAGVRFGRGRPRPFVPVRDASVLVLAAPGEDVSLDPAGAVELWRTFLVDVGRARGEPTIISPIVSAADLPSLRGLAAIVPWDRSTGMRAVRDARRTRTGR